MISYSHDIQRYITVNRLASVANKIRPIENFENKDLMTLRSAFVKDAFQEYIDDNGPFTDPTDQKLASHAAIDTATPLVIDLLVHTMLSVNN